MNNIGNPPSGEVIISLDSGVMLHAHEPTLYSLTKKELDGTLVGWERLLYFIMTTIYVRLISEESRTFWEAYRREYSNSLQEKEVAPLPASAAPQAVLQVAQILVAEENEEDKFSDPEDVAEDLWQKAVVVRKFFTPEEALPQVDIGPATPDSQELRFNLETPSSLPGQQSRSPSPVGRVPASYEGLEVLVDDEGGEIRAQDRKESWDQLLEALATLPPIAWRGKSLNSEKDQLTEWGKKLAWVHPLKQIEYALCDQKNRENFKKLRQREIIWAGGNIPMIGRKLGFIQNFTITLATWKNWEKKERVQTPFDTHMEGFAKAVGGDVERIRALLAQPMSESLCRLLDQGSEVSKENLIDYPEMKAFQGQVEELFNYLLSLS